MDDQPTPDPTMTRIGEAVQLGRSGQHGPARDALTALWDEIGPTGDAFHRCTLAHYLADLQDTTEAELSWDERALAAVSDLTDERAQRYLSSLQVQAFLPSLHLNLADCHRRLGNPAQAREHLARASEHLVHLPNDPYGAAIHAAIRDFAADDPTDARG
ncbi:tetratricopeptide repeat protein [Micromonospora sp. NPDC049101]|uniref:tetratricopeptide repeat protein n=1 Tax=unclassified Micromonospora TaxID=2617518 RepID=UPI0033DE098B